MAHPQAETFAQAFTAARAARVTRPRTPLLVRAGRVLGRVLPPWHAARRLILSVAGFGSLTAAAWTLHTAAGLAAAGVSLLILEALTSGSEQ